MACTQDADWCPFGKIWDRLCRRPGIPVNPPPPTAPCRVFRSPSPPALTVGGPPAPPPLASRGSPRIRQLVLPPTLRPTAPSVPQEADKQFMNAQRLLAPVVPDQLLQLDLWRLSLPLAKALRSQQLRQLPLKVVPSLPLSNGFIPGAKQDKVGISL